MADVCHADFGLRDSESRSTSELPSDDGFTSLEYKQQIEWCYQQSNKTLYGINHKPGACSSVKNPNRFVSFIEALPYLRFSEKLEWHRIVNSAFPVGHPFIASNLHNYSEVVEDRSPVSLHPPCSLESDQKLSGHHKQIGDAIFSHGASCKDIHSYFLKLDPRRCCVHVQSWTSRERSISAGPFAIVKDEDTTKLRNAKKKPSNDKAIHKEGARIANQDYVLSSKDENIYKHVLECAQYPVLCFPLPLTTCDSSQSRSTTLSPTDAIAIERETLYSLLRRAFGVSVRVHNRYEQDVIKLIPERNPAKSLLLELVDQLNQLESNSNMFYRPQNFAELEFYEEWRTLEMDNLRKLIRHWWPDNQQMPAQRIDRFNAHEQYKVFLEKLVSYELREKQNVNMLLSTSSRRLLKEFGLRYGVCKPFRVIAGLESVVNHLSYSDWYLKCVEGELANAANEVVSNFRFLVVEEKVIFSRLLDVLHQKLEYGFIKIPALFPKILSPDGVRSMIRLLSTVIETKRFVAEWGQDQPSVEELIQQYFRVAVIQGYNSCREVAYLTCHPEDYHLKPSAKVLRFLKHDILKNFRYFQDLCLHCPDLESCGIVALVASQLYALYMRDIKELCVERTEIIRTSEVDYEMMGLAYRLSKLDKEWRLHIHECDQKWRIYFMLAMRVTLRAVSEYMIDQVQAYVSSDPMSILDIGFSLGGKEGAWSEPVSCMNLSNSLHLQPGTNVSSALPSSSSSFHHSKASQKGPSLHAENAPVGSAVEKPLLLAAAIVHPSPHGGGGERKSAFAVVPELKGLVRPTTWKQPFKQVVSASADAAPKRGGLDGSDRASVFRDIYAEDVSSTGRGQPERQRHGSTLEQVPVVGLERTSAVSWPGFRSLESQAVLRPAALPTSKESSTRSCPCMGSDSGPPVKSGDVCADSEENRECSFLIRISVPNGTNGNSSHSPISASSDDDAMLRGTDLAEISDVAVEENRTLPTGALTSKLDVDSRVAEIRRSRSLPVMGSVQPPERLEQGKSDLFQGTSVLCRNALPTSTCELRGPVKLCASSAPTQRSDRATLAPVLASDQLSMSLGGNPSQPTSLNELRNTSSHPAASLANVRSACQSQLTRQLEARVDCGSFTPICLDGQSSYSPVSDRSRSSPRDAQLGMSTNYGFSQKAPGHSVGGVLLITSSLVDVLVSCFRLSSLCREVCLLILPMEEHMSGLDTTLRDEYQSLKEDLFRTVVVSMVSVIRTYVLRILALDLCGLKVRQQRELLDSSILAFIKESTSNEMTLTCRHLPRDALPDLSAYEKKPDEVLCCSVYRKLTALSIGHWEPVTMQMCHRVNNLYSLRVVLPYMQDMVGEEIGVTAPKILEQTRTATTCGDIPEATDCTNNPYARDGELCCGFAPCQELLLAATHSQLKILAFRVTKIFKKMFAALFSITFRVERSEREHMKPLLNFMKGQMQAFQRSLYKDCFKALVVQIWNQIVNVFHKLLDDLRLVKDDPRLKAPRLWKILALFLENMTCDDEIHDLLKESMESLSFRFELFKLSSEKLINIHTEATSVLSDRNGILDEPMTYPEVCVKIRNSFKAAPFKGSGLADALQMHGDWMRPLLKNFGFRVNMEPFRAAILVAQKLLDARIILMYPGPDRAPSADAGSLPQPLHGRTDASSSCVDSKYVRPQLGNPQSSADELQNATDGFACERSFIPPDKRTKRGGTFNTSGQYYFAQLDTDATPYLHGDLHGCLRRDGEKGIGRIIADVTHIVQSDYRRNRGWMERQFLAEVQALPSIMRSCSCFF